jgi:anaerobic dimethyl sulfoxide reductase subunit A
MPNTNKVVQAIHKMEFVVVHEQFMTASARYADIILPVTTYMEHDDLGLSTATPAYIFAKKIIEPAGECKTHLEIFKELAGRLGIKGFADKTEEDYIRQMVEGSETIIDYDTFRKESIYKVPLGEQHIAFKAQIEDPDRNPFPTPTGKIEIYSQELANMNDPLIPPIPKYIEPWEGPSDPLRKKYPLQLITTHMIRRAHSVFETVPWLREIEHQAVTMSRVDADLRGIEDSDMVRVFNDRGETVLPVKVTDRIMPGVVDIPEGGWYSPDKDGTDRGGNPNVLTNDRPSPGGTFPSNTALVEIAKV